MAPCFVLQLTTDHQEHNQAQLYCTEPQCIVYNKGTFFGPWGYNQALNKNYRNRVGRMRSTTYFIFRMRSHLHFHNTIKLCLTTSLLVNCWFTL